MITTAFEKAYARLVGAFKRHQDVPRSPDDVAVIGYARWELHLARNAMGDARDDIFAAHHRRTTAASKIDMSEEDLARLQVAAISAGFS